MTVFLLFLLGVVSAAPVENPTMEQVQADISYLKDALDNQSSRNTVLEAEMREFTSVRSTMESEMRDLTSALRTMESRTTSRETEAVVFMVADNSGVSISANQKILYRTIVTNAGAGYSIQQELFICPVSGLYMFTWTNVAAGDNRYITDLYKNSEVMASNFGTNNNRASDASNTVFIHCTTGDRVYVQCGTGYTCNPLSNARNENNMQTFGGFLIKAND